MAGGFQQLGPLEAKIGAYLGLTGSGDGGKEQVVDDLSAEVAAHWAQFEALIAAYDRAETPYISRGRAEKQQFEGDYDHLARRGEWEGGEE